MTIRTPRRLIFTRFDRLRERRLNTSGNGEEVNANCGRIAGYLFNDKGDLLPQKQSRENAEYSFIAPDTNGEWLSQLVCVGSYPPHL
jgi:hypothetical protein